MFRSACFAVLLFFCLPFLGPCAAFAGDVQGGQGFQLQKPAFKEGSPRLLEPVPGIAKLPPAGQLFKNQAITSTTDILDIDVHYPTFGNALVDQDISLWAHRVVETFSKGLASDGLAPRQVRNELKANYTVSHASTRSLTVTYEVWTYTGGIHGNNDIVTLSYDMASGQRLFFEDLLVATGTALKRLSVYCARVLESTLGEDADAGMIRSGTAPELDNYAAFSLFPAGLRVYFQPYQVAPFTAGPQRVDVPLEVILDAGPRLELWGRMQR